MTRDEHALYCPGCGHDGAFDGQGPERRKFQRMRGPGESNEVVIEERYRHRCTECETEFVVVEDETPAEFGDDRPTVDECRHPMFNTLGAQIHTGEGFPRLGVVRECVECSGVIVEERPEIDADGGGEV